MAVSKIMSAVTSAPTIGNIARPSLVSAVLQAAVAGTGAVSATVIIDVSLDGANWLPLATLAMAGTTTASDGFAMSAPWEFVRPRVSAISGTGASVDVWFGV